MITSTHTLIYSDDAPATRAYLRDVLQLPWVADGESPASEQAWLIFATGPSELGVHPTSGTHDGHTYSTPRAHQISLMCDDLQATMAQLRDRGARFAGEARDMGFGFGVLLQVPGADDLLLYEPHHTVGYPAWH